MENKLSDLAFSIETECGCNERSVVLRALRDSARDFCIDSESWIGNFVYAIDPDLNIYDGAGTEDGRVYRLLSVSVSKDSVRYYGSLHDYRLLRDGSVYVNRGFLNHGDYVHIKTVLMPTPESENIPEWLLLRHRDGLIYGACSRICRQIGKPWFSMELSERYRMRYLQEVTFAIEHSAEGDFQG